MPPALHPRSRQTFSLFTTTLAVSFLVVGLPHILPCPVPHTAFADGDNPGNVKTVRHRRQRDDNNEDGFSHRQGISQKRYHQEQQTSTSPQIQQRLECDGGDVRGSESETETADDRSKRRSEPTIQRRRECPVPKPGGLIGQVMGFRENERQKSSVSPVIEVQPRRQKGKEKELISADS